MNAPDLAPRSGSELIDGLAALAQRIGRPMSPLALRAQVSNDPDGAPNPNSLRAALAAGGLLLSRHDGMPTGLDPARFPVLAAMRDGRFRVLARASDLVDGELSAYDGYCLLLAPRPAPDIRSEIPGRRSARAWFWSVLWGLRGYYFHVVLATLLVNVLSLAVSLYTMNVYDRVVPNRTYDTLWVLTIGTAVALAFDLVARTLRGWLIDSAGKRADLEISSGLFQRMLSMQLIQKPASSGSFVNNLREFEAIRDVLTSATMTALVDLPFFLLFVAVIGSIALPLAAVPLVAIALVAIIGLSVQRPIARLIRDSMKEASQRQGLAVESVEGLETLKANNALSFMQQRWDWYTATIAQVSMRSRHLSSFVINATSTIQQFATVATVVIGVYLIHAGGLTMGGLIGVVILGGRAIAPLAQLAQLAVRLQQARTAFDGLQALMDKQTERDPDRTYLSLTNPLGEIALSRVDFAHDPQGAGLFRNLNLSVRAGERVAILGRTGSGKSTLLRLAAGLYTPQSGLATLDGIDLRQLDPAELRAAVALVPQDSRLFLGTLRENLDLARTDRASDDDALVSAMRRFGLDQFVARHPRGLDMQLGEDGQGLSGGQKRLVSLARLALRDPAVALLDEPTSGLDPTTERQVLVALADWAKSRARPRTMIIVTHRPQVLDIVERVIVVEQGRIILDAPREQAMRQLAKGISIPTSEAA